MYVYCSLVLCTKFSLYLQKTTKYYQLFGCINKNITNKKILKF